MMTSKSTKALTVVSSAASLIAAQSAHAAISTALPGGSIVPTTDGFQWDVDGDGNADFSLNRNISSTSSTSGSWNSNVGMNLLNGAKIVVPFSMASTSITSSGTNTYFNAYGFMKLSSGAVLDSRAGTASFNGGQMLSRYGTGTVVGQNVGSNYLDPVMSSGGWNLTSGGSDSGYFGFSFQKDGNTHYGWASMNIGGESGFEITEAYYNDVANGSITVGSVVPEAANSALGLGALAMGAAGVRRMRRKGKAA